MKSILALILAFFAAAAANAALVPATDQTAILALLNRVYATYKANDLKKTWSAIVGVNNIFAQSTLQLWNENDRLLKGDGPGAIDHDIFCDCNDFDGSLKLASATMTSLPNGRVNVQAKISNYGIKTINIQFEKTAAGWRVYDVELPRQGMLRAALINENAELSKATKRSPGRR